MNRIRTHSAAGGFERSASAYDRGRPEYPAEAAERLLDLAKVGSASRVLELGSGTGKFTEHLIRRTPHLVTSDPSPAMRRTFQEHFPQVSCLAARAEELPLASASVDAVICAQAFHWFANAEAMQEIHRVLASSGCLGLIWNVRDEEVGWIRSLTEIIDVHSGDAPRYRTGEWQTPLQAHPGFDPLQRESLRHVVSCDRATVIDRVASISFIAALEEKRHQQVLALVWALLNTHPETRDCEHLAFPYRTDLFWCRKR